MTAELEELRRALLGAVRRSPAVALRLEKTLERAGMAHAAQAWTRSDDDPLTIQLQLLSLELLRDRHPDEFDELLELATAPGTALPPTRTTPGTPGTEKTEVPEVPEATAETDETDETEEEAPEKPVPEEHASEERPPQEQEPQEHAAQGHSPGRPGAAPHRAGDHVDFRDGTFHGPTVGVQHHHYGTAPVPAEWRPADGVGPLEFGVWPTRPVPGLPDVPPYVPRDRDEELRALLARPGLVLILGEPYAGTSYTAWHAVRSLKGHRVYAPDPGEDLRPLVAALRSSPGGHVVWLDELTRHLGPGRLDLPLLGRLNDLGAVVLATMRPAEYYRRRAGTAPGDRVVAAARTVELRREWSEAELARLSARDDPRAYPAYMWSGREGVGSYFAVGHLLFDEWRRPGTRQDHPLGRLLVRAAVDVAQCGIESAVPASLLRKVQKRYGQEYAEAAAREAYEQAFAWATAPMFGVSGLLVEGAEDGTWRAYGALVAEALGRGDLEPVPDRVWWTLLDTAESRSGAGARLDHGAILGAARTALSPRIEAGDVGVAFNLALHTEGEESEALLRRAADGGHAKAASVLALLLVERGDEEEALPYLTAAAQAGFAWAARQLGRYHRTRAEHWLRQAAEAGDGAAAHELGDMLVGPGSEEEALRWYRRAAAAGHREVAGSLGSLLASWNNPEAEEWLRYAAAWGDARAANDLGFHLHTTKAGDAAELESLYRQAAEGGDAAGAGNLGVVLESLGRYEEAESWYRTGHERGATYAAQHLAFLLFKQGKHAEADAWLREAAVVPKGLPATLPPPPPAPPAGGPDTVEE
ncbi:hypothetical protein [Streptomyces cinerochromogenes]|uniref:hypothetical protein n=1 Tax=Streptomyces cinerochromogenes TaxID=66422 RepID=UPI001670258A|nr:hypothetical protein [Streptomyces cinerochromogenes]